MIHVLYACYFLLRLLFANPFVPCLSTYSPTKHLMLVFLVFTPLPSLFLLPIRGIVLSYCALALFALRFAYRPPISLADVTLWRRLFWRLEIPLYFLLLTVLRFLSSTASRLDSVLFIQAFFVVCIFITNLVLRARNQSLPLSFKTFIYLVLRERIPPAQPMLTVPPTVFNTSAFSLLSFQWVTPLISTAFSRPLQHDDINPLHPTLCSHASSNRFQSVWNAQFGQSSNERPPSLVRCLRITFGIPLIIAAIPKLFAEITNMFTPILLRSIIQYLQSQSHQTTSTAHGLYLAFYLFLLNMFSTIMAQQFFLRVYAAKTALHGTLVHSLFQKTVKLSPNSRSLYESGHIQNMMSTDCRIVSSVAIYMHELWAAMLQVCVTLVLLVQLLGWVPTASCLSLVLLGIPLQSYIIQKTTKLAKSVSHMTDQRVNIISEVIKSIKLIKLYAWEIPFLRRIDDARLQELQTLRSVHFLNVWNFLVTSGLSTALTVVAFAAYVALGHPLDAAVVFPAIALFDIMWPAMLYFPRVLVNLAKSISSLSRLQKFLSAEEVHDATNHRNQHNLTEISKNIAFDFRETVFRWGRDDSAGSLYTNSFFIPEGSLVAVVGSTAGGKSTLLAGMLGELDIVSGEFFQSTSPKVSFCDQVPFIPNATVRDNILFGKLYDKKLYETTISACCLLPDFRNLPAGDATEIGSRGVNLSGGQRARVALARAVYHEPDICLMDDPLSAVDAIVGRHLFEKCLVSQMRGKTRILATNHLHVAASQHVDMVIVVHDGCVVETGPRSYLLRDHNSEFSKLLNKSKVTPYRVVESAELGAVSRQQKFEENLAKKSPGAHGVTLEYSTTPLIKDEKMKLLPKQQNANCETVENGKLTTEETKEEGAVKVHYLLDYLLNMNLVQWVLPIAFFKIMELTVAAGVDVWMSIWSENYRRASVQWYMFVFMVLGSTSVLFGGVSVFCLASGSLKASLRIHRQLTLSVLRAPISFFDTTPEGRLMNRFNNDIDRVDTEIAFKAKDLCSLLALMTIRFSLLLWAIPWFVLVLVAIIYVLWIIQQYFRRATVDLKRLEALSFSPLYSHFAETIDGVVTIRAFKDLPRVVYANSVHTDLMLANTYATTYARRWLSMRMNTVGCLLTLVTTIALMNSPSSRVSPSMKGLLLSYVVSAVRIMRWTIKGVTDLESQLSSMERISEYSSKSFVKEEENPSVVPPWTHADQGGNQENYCVDRPGTENPCVHELPPMDKAWPDKGLIVFERVSMRYRPDLEPALKSVSFRIESGEHVGIVGRTGAGKSTVIQTLFRLHKLMGGCINIDGVDISSLSLQDLRSRIGVIPQEPVCFSGTIRTNLDMLNCYPEHEVRRVFELCGLAQSTKVGLDHEVSEGGANLSVGQRQLLCLGRALLRQSKVVVLDEATSSVSAEIDSCIQETIRKEMDGCTVLIVAHRLDTVMSCDRIMVMQSGRVAEYGRPRDLLAKDSFLNELVDETGPDAAVRLRALAGVSPPT
ncbi:unnamed protein product [Agarophyton chilense]|eukprot:gb/GEZJ01004516.1/.p1 GENE.gb/GEZJ01004516.1/~~gb/GEZJ01004516.1/.p1  ORF type:complete len:1495 (-),score=158.93 gb/GEZJ01004516.1/:1244-5728(-)